MKIIILIIFLSVTITLQSQLVKTGEIRIFSFETDAGKTAVLCKGENDSYVVYRYGTGSKIEFQFPDERSDLTWKDFTYSFYLRGGGKENAGIDLNYLTFKNNGYKYKLYQEYSAEDNSESAGIIVIDKELNETDIKAVKNSVKGSLTDLRYVEKLKKEEQ